MKDLAPGIHRQRLVIEGRAPTPISASDIESYLTGLSGILAMTVLLDPVTHRSDRYGWAGWIHWETSGAHFYAWEDPNFFSVDIYTCKAFDPLAAVDYTTDFFSATAVEFDSFGQTGDRGFVRVPSIDELTGVFLKTEARADRDTKRFGLYVIDGDSVFADLGRRVELEVFDEYFGNHSDVMRAEYDPFDSASTFLLVIDHKKVTPAGVVRLIGNSVHGHKSLNDIAGTGEWGMTVPEFEAFHGFEWDLERTFDLATIAALPDYRDGLVSAALYHAVYWYSLVRDVDRWVAIFDNQVLDMLWAFEIPFVTLGDLPSINYLDSPLSTAVTLDVNDVRAGVRSASPPPYASFVKGDGVLDAVSLPDLILTDPARSELLDLT